MMQLEAIKPEIEQYIEDQVKSGNFSTREAVVEAGILSLMLDGVDHKLTEADVAAIDEADAEYDRGEYVDFDTFAAEMRKKYCQP